MKLITLIFILCVFVNGSMPSEIKFVRWISRKWSVKRDATPSYNAASDVKFSLFTRLNPAVGQQIKLDDIASLNTSHFDAQHPTRFTIHGWKGHGKSQSNQIICDAYLSRGEFNVIAVDWAAGAKTINYYRARQRVKETGRTVANFIKFLEVHGGLSLDALTLVGHSLGAHVAGFAGKFTHGQINTIFGLDPAGPLFSLNSHSERLCENDAKYVETIITDGGYLGLFGKIGNATFFPNGGKLQPGCSGGVNKYRCAHKRAYHLFAESVKKDVSPFVAEKCSNITDIVKNVCHKDGTEVRMGGEPSNFAKAIRGVFMLLTHARSPFARGKPEVEH